MHKAEKLKLDGLLTRTCRLEQVNQAFADMERGANARGAITFPGV
jgi:Zn-dependent alcohol dehydrogenase